MFPGRPLPYPYPPGQPGHEAVGIVAALGAGVSGPPVGARVAAWRDQGHTRPGAYAQFNLFEADNLLPVPTDLPMSAVAPLELAMCVQVSFDQLQEMGGVTNTRVGVSGLGPAGLIAVQMARAYGAAEIVAVDPLPQRRALSVALGADIALSPEELTANLPQTHADAASLRTGKRLDWAIECTGLATSLATLMSVTRKAVAVFGVLRDPVEFGFAQWASGIALLGYIGHSRGAAERALKLVEEGRLHLASLVTHQLPLRRYTEGVELLRRREAIKIGFLPWD
jgi:threonine dehydrogenase-like Zn-dependent dehydrogenase